MAEYCDVQYKDGKLICYLPITRPKSKWRVLRSDHPVATRTTQLTQEDIIEWQISYFDERGRMEELARLLDLAYHNNLVEAGELHQRLSEISEQQEFFAERYSISTAPISMPGDFYGFNVLNKTVPILIRNINNVLIWVELRPKQIAVGFQPMIYLRIPIEAVSPNLVGRTAQPKQLVTWESSTAILMSTVRAFSVASKKHKNDMVKVLKQVLRI